MEGTVKFYNRKKGFGFVSGDDGTDYFVHISSLPQGLSLRDNDRVSFDPSEGERGPKADNVQLLEKASDREGDSQMEESYEAPAEEATEEPVEESTEEAPAEEEATEEAPAEESSEDAGEEAPAEEEATEEAPAEESSEDAGEEAPAEEEEPAQ